MAAKTKGKPSKSSFGDDDILDSSFDDNKLRVRRKLGRTGLLHGSSDDDNIFSMLAEEDAGISITDPNDILDDIKATNSPSAETKPDNEGLMPELVIENDIKPGEAADEATIEGKKITSSTSARTKKFSFSDLDGDLDAVDDFVDLLDGLPTNKSRPRSISSSQATKPEKSAHSATTSHVQKKETTSAAKKQSELTFDDEKDDLIDDLGLDSDTKNPQKKDNVLWSNRESGEHPQRSRTRLDDILENYNSRSVEWSPTGAKKDQPPSRQNCNLKEALLEDDLIFGSYQPTVGATPAGPQSRRQSIRFSTEDVSPATPEKKPPIAPTSTRPRNPADWLCLKANDEQSDLEDDVKEKKTSPESPKSPFSPLLERKSSLTGSQRIPATKIDGDAPPSTGSKVVKPDVTRSRKIKDDDDDWLAGALSRKKSFSGSNSDVKVSKQEQSLGLGEEVDLELLVSKEATSQTRRGRENIVGKQSSSSKDAGSSSLGQPSPASQSAPDKDQRAKQALSQQNQIPNSSTAVHQQMAFSADSLQQLILQQQMMQSQLLGLQGVLDVGALQRLNEQQSGDDQDLQARIIQLEGQIKTLQLERDHSQLLLESAQQRHKQDMELMENAHKTRVKLLEESTAQRETRMRQESEDLIERLATVTQAAEKERSDLQAHYQRKLAQFQQDQDRDVERLRDLQRKSIMEMKNDHEDHVNRLKRLKEEEIDAVTSATSETRSLTLVIEQMEQFSSRLGDLSTLVESRHEHTTQGLEQGARHRDEQLRIMQERLAQQQKAMAEEKAYLKEIISRMDTQINEQQRQLEKERWKVTAEQAKVESSVKSLEEERRSLTMQMNMEREELEKAKSALLEEQKSVMQQCAEERRKLAAEWTIFHAQEKQRRERVEQDVSTLLDRREGSIMSLAQEQADLKLRGGELKQREAAVAQEREALEQLRGELDREKERISSTALRLKIRAQEVDDFSKMAAEKYEEGEQALQEAKRVEAEHQSRLRTIHSQIERLRQLEQRTIQERIRFNQQETTEKLRPNPSSGSQSNLTVLPLPDSGSVIPDTKQAPTLNATATMPSSQSVALQAHLAIWKYNARKDHDYLQEQQIFLNNLKKKSYRQNKSHWTPAV
ncbi:fas-binding factor 1 homolog [Dunckerocampus dactyliophorus]|uniref:fas-binding factor 1 homolog n=1 Tax=Dunckerocampus dactyliophorus TaxID=161453 RepID=UPI0024063EBD|nr:fas-binding factor 1 homolog [Dunckerocampus dactyliophorus]